MFEIDTQTKLCGVIGNPVHHSLSPAIHNAAFRKMGLNFVYLAFPVEVIGDAMKGLRALGNCRGFSVTIPHKLAAMPFLDEVDQTAQHIGAINTIVVEKTFGGSLDKARAIQVFNARNEEVRRSAPGERLLVYESGDGWEPLCDFLRLPVPATPYPKVNTTGDFVSALAAYWNAR